MRVFKFLGEKHARSDIEKRHIKISRVADLNDPFELLPVNTSRRPGLRRTLESWRTEMDQQHGLLCFSATWQDPVLWSHYGDKHRGVCLGYDLQDAFAEPVRYREDRIKPQFSTNGELVRNEQLTRDMLFSKYERWRYEDEIRTWVGLDPKTVDESGHYFYDYSAQLALREVILGPLCKTPISEYTALVKDLSPAVYVKATRLAYSKFSVVELDLRLGDRDE